MLSEQDAMVWKFLQDGYEGGRILAADCSEALIRKVKELSPKPELVQWTWEQQMAFCWNQWPDTKGVFRYILLGRLAERMEDIYAFRQLQEHLTYDGTLISLWGNVQHWTVIRDLLKGRWYFSDNPIFPKEHHRLFSKEEILELFRVMHYKNMRVDYLALQGEPARLEQLRLWSGMESCLALEVVFWCVEARLFKDEVIALRRQLTSELRKELARILRRIENDIEPGENCGLVREICKNQKVSKEYLEAFVRNVTLNPHKVLAKLQEHNIHE